MKVYVCYDYRPLTISPSDKTSTELHLNVKFLFGLVSLSLLLTGCAKAPSQLACEVWNEKLQEVSVAVDYWAELSISRKLTLEENKLAWKDQNSYIAVLREMDSVGCKY